MGDGEKMVGVKPLGVTLRVVVTMAIVRVVATRGIKIRPRVMV